MSQIERATGFLFIISGPSGVGKDTLLKALRGPMPDMHFVTTATTRPRSSSETDGVDYFFVSRERFEQMIRDGALLEYSIVHGTDYYGVPKEQVRQALARGQDVIMRIDVQGCAKIRRDHPQAVAIFLVAESMEELKQRILQRKRETDVDLQTRLETAKTEMARIDEFDYVVANCAGRQDDAVASVVAIIRAERCRTHRRLVTL
jgi:guanylate kinase